MSADNFYVLRKHPKGYCFVMGFASDDEDTAMTCDVSSHEEVFPTISDAMADWKHGLEFDEELGGYPKYYNEYGLRISPEVEADIALLEKTPTQPTYVNLCYPIDKVIGSATLDECGNIVMTVTDPRIIEFIRQDRKIVGITLINAPGYPSDMPVINPIAEEVDKLLSPHMD